MGDTRHVTEDGAAGFLSAYPDGVVFSMVYGRALHNQGLNNGNNRGATVFPANMN